MNELIPLGIVGAIALGAGVVARKKFAGSAGTGADVYPTPYDGFFQGAAARHGVDWKLLKAIALWEHRGVIRPKDVAKEKNGTISVGVFQINSANFPWVARTFGWQAEDLKDPRKNIEVGAALLADIQRTLKARSATFTRDHVIQAWSLGATKVAAGYVNSGYLAGVRGYLDKMERA